MSTELNLDLARQELSSVQQLLIELAERISRLNLSLSSIESTEGGASDWEVIEEGVLPIGVSDLLRPYTGASSVPSLTPVPPVPRYLTDLCIEKLRSSVSVSANHKCLSDHASSVKGLCAYGTAERGVSETGCCPHGSTAKDSCHSGRAGRPFCSDACTNFGSAITTEHRPDSPGVPPGRSRRGSFDRPRVPPPQAPHLQEALQGARGCSKT